MSNTVIKVENLSKQYRLGLVGTGTLSHDLNRWWHRIRGKEDPYLKVGETNVRSSRGDSDYVWALRDINFDVKHGEILGIIGKNGAGKSTLLKILSKVTGPTVGSIKAKGRIASLLEVGTGFHPELTGRENIYLNGTILGMTKVEVKKKLDEIVDFAGVARYLDTPVKRYSSGMMVRLGFAVAAHLEPEILVVDEVLAVGDAEFQKKAVGKMKEVSGKGGRTVLFVSHNMQSVTSLTKKAILLEDGCIAMLGSTDKVVNKYLAGNKRKGKYENFQPNHIPHIASVECITTNQGNVQAFGKELDFCFRVNCPYPLKNAAISYQIFNSKGVPATHILLLNQEKAFCNKPGIFHLVSRIPKVRLYPDQYSLTVHFADNFTKEKIETIENICPFEVKVFGEIRDYYWGKNNATYIEENEWNISYSTGKSYHI